MYDPNQTQNPNQVAYNWAERSTFFQPSHNIPEAHVQSQMHTVITDVTENSGIKDGNMMAKIGYAIIGIAAILLILGFIAGAVLGTVIPAAAGTVFTIACLASCAGFIVGVIMVAAFHKSFLEKKKQKVSEHIATNMARYLQMVPGWGITYSFIINQRVYFVKRTRRHGKNNRRIGGSRYTKQRVLFI